MKSWAIRNDKPTSYDVLVVLLARLDDEYDYFKLLHPTSPLRNASHVKEVVELFESRMDQFDFLVSMKESEHVKVLVNLIEEEGSLKYFDTDFSNTDYSPNGAIFMAKTEAYLERKHFFGTKTVAYVMDSKTSTDVDNYIDILVARLL